MNSQMTTSFMDTWSTMDLESLIDFFSDDAVYTNIPMGPPNRGKAEIKIFIEGFLGMATEIKFTVHHQIEAGNGMVMNERTDTINFGSKVVELPVMGVFEFRDGKICAWRDYFDMACFSK